ncbi:MAG: hypothetical protein Q9174_000565 [Haloplaca sp. 1 TL-2023]
MGNTSSQQAPVTPAKVASPPGAKDTESSAGKKRKWPVAGKAHHKKSEKGSAGTLELSKDHHYVAPDSSEEVASSQLVASDSSGHNRLEVPIDAPTTNESINAKQGGKKKRKHKRTVLDDSMNAWNTQASSAQFSREAFANEVAPNDTYAGAEIDSVLPQSTSGLDDIDENEEGLSSLFQEYETDAIQPESLVAGFPETHGDDLAPFDRNLIDPSLADHSAPTLLAEDRSGRKRKRKRPRHSALDDGAEQQLAEATGQHAFDIDFQAFDEIFANEDMQVANPFPEESGHDLPSGTGPPEERHIMHGDGLLDADWHASNVNNRLAMRANTPQGNRRKKRRRTEAPNSNSPDSQPPIHISPYAPNQGQQDRILPGFEDVQARTSSEIPYSRRLDQGNDASNPNTPTRHNQKAPPRLKNPSTKSLGNKKQRGGKKGKDYNPPLAEISEKGGMFSEDEIAKLEAFRDRYCAEEEISQRRFNEMIQSTIRGNHDSTRLFNALYEEMPYRTRQSVLRFCRRRFHNFRARGAWTEADDEDLRNAVAEKGRSWKAVGAMIDRFPEDCRDRYRNYHVNEDKRHTDTWSREEIYNLVKAVDDCMRFLGKERQASKEHKYRGRDMPESEPESDPEVQDMKLVNWQIVSERMGGTRSRLQCSYKWNHLKNIDRIDYLKAIRTLRKGKGLKLIEGRKSGSWRLKRARRKLRNMRLGDRFDFLQVFAECNAPTEQSIDWMFLGTPWFRDRWSTWDLRAALETFKGEVPGSEGMNYQDVINQLYTKLLTEDPAQFDDRWDPSVHGDINKVSTTKEPSDVSDVANNEMKKKVRRQESRRVLREQKSGKKPKFKSAAFIKSDDESDAEKTSSQSNRNGEEHLDSHGDESTPAMDTTRKATDERGSSPGKAASASLDTVTDTDTDDSLFKESNNVSSNDSVTQATSRDARGSALSDSDSDDSLFNEKGDFQAGLAEEP